MRKAKIIVGWACSLGIVVCLIGIVVSLEQHGLI